MRGAMTAGAMMGARDLEDDEVVLVGRAVGWVVTCEVTTKVLTLVPPLCVTRDVNEEAEVEAGVDEDEVEEETRSFPGAFESPLLFEEPPIGFCFLSLSRLKRSLLESLQQA